jgi:O-antigen ligase
MKRLFSSYPIWFTGFVFLLAFLPLPFGSNRTWASDFMGLWVGALLVLEIALPDISFLPLTPLPRKRLAVAGGLFALVLIWAVVQAVPWTPALWHHPLWNETAPVTGSSVGSISLAPSALTESLIRLLSYAGIFILALRIGRTPDLAPMLLRAVAIAGLVYALYGLTVQSFGFNTILWYEKWAYRDFLTSTFVNKNSYATYGGLGLLCSFALLWRRVKHVRSGNAFLIKRARFAAFLESVTPRDSLYLFLPMAFLSAIILSGSRAGFVSCVAGSLVFLFALALNRRWGGRKGLIPLAFLIATLGLLFTLFAFSGNILATRSDNGQIDEDSMLRLNAYRLEERAIADNPWLGFGLGSFENAFRLYRDESLPLWFQHAHNDYLEAGMELGVPAAGALLGAILLLVSCCVQGVWSRKRREIFPIVGLSASVLVGLHSFVDFGLQIPAIAGTYAALLGLGVGQTLSEKKDRV